MRSEREIFNLILDFAKKNDTILTVYMNGSRANPNAPKDIFMDYDIVYVVEKTKPFIDNKEWITYFGEIAVMQEPDNSGIFDDCNDPNEVYTYLMQFVDGVRIDLSYQILEVARRNYLKDKLSVLLLDKYGILPPNLVPSDEDYNIKRPSFLEYKGCCNEFWWVSTYISKGLARNEILYAIDHFNFNVRPMLIKMLEWYVGTNTDFKVNVGKNDKYLDKYLPKDIWKKLIKTYPSAENKEMWNSLFIMCELFDFIARYVGEKLDFSYDEKEAEKTIKHLIKVKKMK